MRLRQLNPQQYRTNAQISAEFENLIRYLNAAELGNKTQAELNKILFDDEGEWNGPVEMRFTLEDGLEYRVGTYTDINDGWILLAEASALRGASGEYTGTVGTPLLSQAYVTTFTGGSNVIIYDHDAPDDLLIFLNGVLQTPDEDYTATPTDDFDLGTVEVFSAVDGDTFYGVRIRENPDAVFTRVDSVTTGFQSTFPTTVSDDDDLQVYVNGILQTEGSGYDFVRDAANNLVVFNSPIPAGSSVTRIVFVYEANVTVVGLMMERDYVDASTGGILWSKIKVEDDEINPVQVAGLDPHMAATALYTSSAVEPDPNEGYLLWRDVSVTPARLKFSDTSAWYDTAPETLLPAPTSNDASKAVFVNGQGTGFIFDEVDLSSTVKLSHKGAANGVAPLNSDSRLPVANLPEVVGRQTLYKKFDGALVDGTDYIATRIFKQKVRITGFSVRLTNGTADGEFTVNGVPQVVSQSLSVNPVDYTMSTPLEVDASNTTVSFGITVNNQSSANDLEISIAIEEINT